MSQIKSKFIVFDTTATGVNARVVPANFTPSSYTPAAVGSEGTDKISSHLKGIDTALTGIASTPGDIGLTSFSAANNQAAAANVTGLAFANASVRAAEVLYSITISATSNLFESGRLVLIQKGASWEFSQTTTGDASLVTFSITTAGQVQYTTPSYAGFVSATIKFRAIVTSV